MIYFYCRILFGAQCQKGLSFWLEAFGAGGGILSLISGVSPKARWHGAPAFLPGLCSASLGELLHFFALFFELETFLSAEDLCLSRAPMVIPCQRGYRTGSGWQEVCAETVSELKLLHICA